jgi:hypothetical protein
LSRLQFPQSEGLWLVCGEEGHLLLKFKLLFPTGRKKANCGRTRILLRTCIIYPLSFVNILHTDFSSSLPYVSSSSHPSLLLPICLILSPHLSHTVLFTLVSTYYNMSPPLPIPLIFFPSVTFSTPSVSYCIIRISLNLLQYVSSSSSPSLHFYICLVLSPICLVFFPSVSSSFHLSRLFPI